MESGKHDRNQEETSSSLDLSENECMFFNDDDDDDDILEFAPDSVDTAKAASLVSAGGRHRPARTKKRRELSREKEGRTEGCLASALSVFLTFCSFCLTMFSILFLGFGIYHGYSSFGQTMPIALQFSIMMLVLLIVFYCEGLKIAIVSTAHLDHAAVHAMGGNSRALQVHLMLHPSTASAPHTKESLCAHQGTGDETSSTTQEEPTSKSDGVDQVKRFLLGRQQMVVPLGFLFAQLTHFSFFPRGLLPACLYYPLVTIGVPGILVLLQFAQLTPQLLAEEQSMSFLGMRGAYTLTKVALVIETFGITSFTWLMFACLDFVMRTEACHRRGEEFDYYDDTDTDSVDDRLISIELGNRQNFGFLAAPKRRQLQYLSNPVHDTDSISV